MSVPVYTIGYSGFPSIGELLSFLKEKSVDGLIDVRSVPFSKTFPAYNQESLKAACRQHEVYYRHYKKEFGARRTDPTYYTDGYVDFERVSEDPDFKAGIERVKDSANKGYRLCLLCAEKDPIICHRSILIGRNLMDAGINVIHLHADRTEETQQELQTRLLDTLFPKREQTTLWEEQMTEGDYIQEAYRMQNARIGYQFPNEP